MTHEVPEDKKDFVADPIELNDELSLGVPIGGGLVLLDSEGDYLAYLDDIALGNLYNEIGNYYTVE